jgi:AcrR family transcriptional regulator
MSPKLADPGVRTALIEAAARLVAEGGREALTIRRLAAEVGTSTMAVYTHYGGMDDLMREMRKEGFMRLAAFARAVPQTRDPVADLSALGWAYCANAITNPHLYRVMFFDSDIDTDVAQAGLSAFEPLVTTTKRCIEAGRFDPADEWRLALQLWTMAHGIVTLVLAGLIDEDSVEWQMPAMGRAMFIGFGDDPKAADRSIKRAMDRMKKLMPHATADRLTSLRSGNAEAFS